MPKKGYAFDLLKVVQPNERLLRVSTSSARCRRKLVEGNWLDSCSTEKIEAQSRPDGEW